MAENSIPQAQSQVLDGAGRFTVPWFRFLTALEGLRRLVSDNQALALLKANNLSDVASSSAAFGNIKQSASGATTGVVKQTQTWELCFQVAKVTTNPIKVIQRSVRARVVTMVVTVSRTGTCTLTGSIDGTPLGGTANSVSTTESEQTHSSANSIAVGQTLTFTPSSVSSCEDMVVHVSGTYSLDV